MRQTERTLFEKLKIIRSSHTLVVAQHIGILFTTTYLSSGRSNVFNIFLSKEENLFQSPPPPRVMITEITALLS